mgnify:CR=1 FL=1
MTNKDQTAYNSGNYDVIDKYEPLFCLTSKQQPKKAYLKISPVLDQARIFVNADTAYPEAICRMIDYFFTEEGILLSSEGVEGETYDLNDDYEEIKGRAGRIYSDICELNDICGIRIYGEYDHYLVFCIAGWLIDNKPNLYCLRGKTQKQVASDITNQIFEYLKAYNKN